MPTTLQEIVAATRLRIADARRRSNLRDLEERAAQHRPRGFRNALTSRAGRGPAIIAELKKASPSRGLIRADFDPAHLAGELERAGAAALSVLTDEKYFQGSLENLTRASASTTLPCLRKDFILDEFQILEARAYKADAILLIVAALSQNELTTLAAQAAGHGLDVLCEAHDQEEVAGALGAGCSLIGINSRDLKTFKVDPETLFRLAELLPGHVLRVAESGIHSGADIARLRAAGYQAFLVGESLMKAASPGAALQLLIAAAEESVPLRTD